MGKTPSLYNVFFFAWIVFYVFEIIVRKMKGSIGRNHGMTRIHGLWFALVAIIVLEIAEAFMLLQIGYTPQFACSQIRMTAYLLTIAVILIFCYFDKTGKLNGSVAIVRGVIYIGDCSYGIFFTHYFLYC